ncbi:MAG: D-alanine--D-alanine ligase family protein [Filifactoraceae bacterium]
MKLGIFFGGRSAEHKVSCMSAASVYENLDKSKFTPYLIGVDYDGKLYHFTGDLNVLRSGEWKTKVTNNKVVILDRERNCGIYGKDIEVIFDVVFPVMHGPYGEDGKIQGVFSYEGIPYVGPGIMEAAITMDKDITKQILKSVGINQVPYKVIKNHQDIEGFYEELSDIGYPLFVKPANLGSSLGISKARNKEELFKACENARKYDSKIIVEKGYNVRELEIAVLGNRNKVEISAVGEIVSCDEFYDYDAKYTKNQSELIIPANLGQDVLDSIKDMTKKAYEIMDIEGMARIDFFMDKDSGNIYLNEINTIPGFTHISMYPKLFEYSGIAYRDLLTKLIELAFERGERQGALRYK